MLPKYDVEKIKFATDKGTFERAVELYQAKKITEFEDFGGGCRAIVLGSRPYKVIVSSQNFDEGECECYLGQNEILCKHMVAVALWAVKRGEALAEKEIERRDWPVFSGRKGDLNQEEVQKVKEVIAAGLRYIKPYNGPSRIWFAYQDSLSEGCRRLAAGVSELPASRLTARLLVKLLMRLDRKLMVGGVDDSDGTVGGFIEQTVGVLKEFVRLEPECAKEFEVLKNQETVFGWEEELVNKVF